MIATLPRAPMTIGPYVVDGDTVHHPDGTPSAVLRTDELDVGALDGARQSAVLAGFARLCHTLETSLQLVVRVRRVPPDAMRRTMPRAAADPAHRTFDDAMEAFWRQRLTSRAAHTRTVLIAITGRSQDALSVHTAHVLNAVRGLGITGRRLHDADLADAVGGGLPVGAALAWTVHPQHVRMGAMLLRSYRLRRLPGHPVTPGWLAPLLRVDAECDIAIHLAPASLGDALNTLGRRLRDFAAHRMLESERGALNDVHVDIALDSAFELRARLARNAGRPLHMSVTATACAPDHAQLQRAGDAVRVAFHSAMAGCEPTHFRQLPAMLTTRPLGVDTLGAVKLVDSAAAALCLPWVDAGCDDADGYRLGEALRSRVPVRLAPFDAGRHNNANIAVLAASGHGKSFAMGTLMLEAAAHDVGCIVIDPEGEYERVVTALGGEYLSLAPATGTALNVLDAGVGGVEDAIAALVDLAGVVCGALTDLERALVDRAGRAAFEQATERDHLPTLRDCLPHLEGSAPRVAAVLQRYCTGALGDLFDRPTSVRLDGAVAGISLRDTPPEHVAAVTLLVARWLWQLVREAPRPRHLLFDEVGALCAYAAIRTLLVQLARRCRKYGASLVVATQNAQDLLGSDEGSVIATNCATVLLGGHRSAETARMEQAFGLTDSQRRFLETAARGEFLLLAGDRRLPIRIDVPPEHAALLRPRGA